MATPITVTATVQNPSSTALTSGAFVRFRLRNFQGYVPRISGTSIVCETQIDAEPNGSGVISQPLWKNSDIIPANTYWTVELWSLGRITSSANYIFNTDADLSSASQMTTPPIPPTSSALITWDQNGNMFPVVGNTIQSLGDVAAPWNAELRSQNAILYADAFSSLQAAHDALPSSGGKIMVPAGTYTAAGTVLSISKNNVTIEGVGPQSIVYGTAPSTYPTLTQVISVAGHNCKIRNLAVQGTASDITTSQVGIDFTGSTGGEVDHCTFDSLNIAIALNGDNHDIHDNVIGTMFGDSTVSTGYGIILVGSSNNFIHDNLITFSTSYGRHQIYVSQNSCYNDIGHNICLNGVNIQIQVYSLDSQDPAQYNNVHDNICSGSQFITASNNGLITIVNNAPHNKVDGNIIIGGLGCHGISLFGAQATKRPDYCQVTNNHISLSGWHGIAIVGASHSLVSGNDITSPSQASASVYSGIGLLSDTITYPDRNKCVSNRVGGSGYACGIDIQTGTTYTLLLDNSVVSGTAAAINNAGTNTLFGVNVTDTTLMLVNTPIVGSATNGVKFTTGAGSTILPTVDAGGLIADVGSTLGSGSNKAYGVIGAIRGGGDASGDRAYGGFFSSTAQHNTSTEVGVHAETHDAGGVAAEFGYNGTVKAFFSAGGALTIDGATPTGSGTQLGIGNSVGFGNGTPATTVTTTTKGTGSGPTTAQTIVKYLEIDVGGTKYWVPLFQ